jgi:hypothetical protein
MQTNLRDAAAMIFSRVSAGAAALDQALVRVAFVRAVDVQGTARRRCSRSTTGMPSCLSNAVLFFPSSNSRASIFCRPADRALTRSMEVGDSAAPADTRRH